MPFIILLLEADKNSPELVAPLLDPIADDPKANFPFPSSNSELEPG